MQAEIAVGVELALMPEYAELTVAGKDDPAVSILELGDLTDKLLGHPGMPPRFALFCKRNAGALLVKAHFAVSLYDKCSPATSGKLYWAGSSKTHASPVIKRAWWSASRFPRSRSSPRRRA